VELLTEVHLLLILLSAGKFYFQTYFYSKCDFCGFSAVQLCWLLIDFGL